VSGMERLQLELNIYFSRGIFTESTAGPAVPGADHNYKLRDIVLSLSTLQARFEFSGVFSCHKSRYLH
jgi:hypothetical protein